MLVYVQRVLSKESKRAGAMTPCEYSDGQISVTAANGTGAAPWSRVVETDPPFLFFT